ncbi:general secretion pathway protein L [Comamonas odontotermitis]|uniref:General secretion pathway protein L n=1 Tax=Comamonas odontotermitis TaxID=379895 RepID=A0ABR6RCB7_9BURK|nr:PilN domain-containing protein [Comamonas odontotermitis]MBB6576799.1 general secretion pathway protein L [Comamonas odontotermitis]
MALSTDSRFFGLDLNQLKADVLKTWQKAPQWPPLSWLRPEQALTLVPTQGDPVVVWESGSPAPDGKRAPEFWAVEIPESMVLRKTLQLPALDPQDCASAAQLEVQAISPFAAADVLWGYAELSRSSQAVRMQLVLASRTQVEPYIQSKIAERQQTLAENAKPLLQPEVWVFAPQRQPIVIHGFGEGARAAAGRKKLMLNAVGVGVAALLCIALALTPTAQLRLRAIEAVHAYEGMAAKTTDVVGKREQLMQSADKVAALSELLAERVDSVKVLSMLTKILPDDTALQSARVQGNKVTLVGLTENSSTLMQKLSNEEGVKDVRAPSAATRLAGANRESFTIELTLDNRVFGPTLKVEDPPPPSQPAPADGAGAQPAAASNEAPAAAPAALSAAPAPAPAAAPATPQPTPPQSAPPSSANAPKGPTLGGSRSGPSLGGSKPAPAQETRK